MHPNPAFHTATPEENLHFARQRGFGILSVNGPDGPLAAHIPFLLDGPGKAADLHLARSNPIARACAAGPIPALIAVSGPDAYISPDWYGTPDQVPTWNYIAVHLRGTLAALPEDALQIHVEALSDEHEARLLPKKPWTTEKMSDGVLPRMMRMILPFRFTLTGIDGTWKLGQNKSAQVRQAAALSLSDQPDPGSRAIAALMQALPD